MYLLKVSLETQKKTNLCGFFFVLVCTVLGFKDSSDT